MSSKSKGRGTRDAGRGAIALVLAATLIATSRGAQPKFYPDDPLAFDDDRVADAAGARETESSDLFDFAENTFMVRGDRDDVRAMNVNTIDEVPDSSWFTNRIGRRPMSIEEIVRGPDRFDTLSIDGWPITQGKNEGLQGGWRVTDPSGSLYQIEFDPPTNPEMATGAEMIGTAFYHAFGYNVVDAYLVEVDPARLVISPNATIKDFGVRRRFTRNDVDDILRQAARMPNGKYRAIASRFADGDPLGNFRYFGTRPDDPNDVFPHEHRRELRGNRVFAAWLNHDDSRGINSLDMLDGTEGRRFVKHYMFDFGSIMGSGTAGPQVPRAGNEHMFEWTDGLLTLATFGLYVRPWLFIEYPKAPPAVGNFEGSAFAPETWKPEYPNPAFRNMRADDAFWGARIVAKFSDEMIRRIVDRAKYSDPKAAETVTNVLIQRRNKVVATWLNQVNPIIDVRLDPKGQLDFRNASVDAGVGAQGARYQIEWFTFDNVTSTHKAFGGAVTVNDTRAQAPAALLTSGDYVGLVIRGVHPGHRFWNRPTLVYFRRDRQGGWTTVGIERQPRDVAPIL